MNTFKKMALVAAMLGLGSAHAQAVPGEKLDSGLGMLSKSYIAAEYMPGHVAGESLDSGLGELAADYNAWEFMPAGSLAGESLDSGLGALTAEDLQQYMTPAPVLRTALDR